MADKEEESEMSRDAKLVKSLLKSMGVEDYEPRVIYKFLELWYSEHASKSSIDFNDVKLAIQSKVLLELAEKRNKIPLSKSIVGSGVPIPPDQNTLISPNYQLAVTMQKRAFKFVQETENAFQKEKTD